MKGESPSGLVVCVCSEIGRTNLCWVPNGVEVSSLSSLSNCCSKEALMSFPFSLPVKTIMGFGFEGERGLE